jgi:hypothetical protein
VCSSQSDAATKSKLNFNLHEVLSQCKYLLIWFRNYMSISKKQVKINNLYEIFYERTRKRWLLNRGDVMGRFACILIFFLELNFIGLSNTAFNNHFVLVKFKYDNAMIEYTLKIICMNLIGTSIYFFLGIYRK